MAGPHAPTLAVDVDGTIWSCYERAFDEVERLTGDRLNLADMTSYDYLFDRYSREIGIQAFAFATEPSYCVSRTLYEGCEKALKSLKVLGINVRFVTHNHDPDRMRDPVTAWLQGIFGEVPVDVMHTSENKADHLLEIGAFGIVDDKPESLENVADLGLLAMTLVQPWNKDLVFERPDVNGFVSWDGFLRTFAGVTPCIEHSVFGGWHG